MLENKVVVVEKFCSKMKDGLRILQRCVNILRFISLSSNKKYGCLVKSFIFYCRENVHILTCLQHRRCRDSEKSCHPAEGKRFQFLGQRGIFFLQLYAT